LWCLRAPEKQLNNDIYVVSSYIFEIYVLTFLENPAQTLQPSFERFPTNYSFEGTTCLTTWRD
jgi:hypothetical protein